MFSTVPGFDSPKAALRSEKDVYVSASAATAELLNRNPKGESFASAGDDMFLVELLAAGRNWRNGGV
jgi:hypothetical protein